MHATTRGPMGLPELLALPATTDLETAGRALGIGRSSAYELHRLGQFPVTVLKLGNRFRVPTASLLGVLGVERPNEGGAPTEGAPAA